MVGKTALENLQNLHACAKLVYVMSQVTAQTNVQVTISVHVSWPLWRWGGHLPHILGIV